MILYHDKQIRFVQKCYGDYYNQKHMINSFLEKKMYHHYKLSLLLDALTVNNHVCQVFLIGLVLITI